ncbi:hypothetical protein GQX73_g972 [Xylaria multiplex]|uniref:Uncharacterized protein n=1 Tax=Xylaria multiplex TaxID=323545 RepID=A0A7C8IXL5_9PEZI|nr:hypothetical protein GQX73_g972 [Xylaria multiplex]
MSTHLQHDASFRPARTVSVPYGRRHMAEGKPEGIPRVEKTPIPELPEGPVPAVSEDAAGSDSMVPTLAVSSEDVSEKAHDGVICLGANPSADFRRLASCRPEYANRWWMEGVRKGSKMGK